MADTLVRDMTADASPTGDDLIYVVNDPAGTPGNRKVTLTNLLGFVEANISGLATSVITSGTFADARIAQTNVTQHEAALTITESQISDLGTYLTDIVSDTTPQLGGSLDVNGQSIVSISNGNITLAPNGTGNVILGNFVFDADQTVGAGQDNYVLTYDNSSGLISLEAAAGGGLTLPYSDGDSVTGSASTTTFELTPTWNTTGNPKGLVVDVTNTASGVENRLVAFGVSGSASKRFDVGVGSTLPFMPYTGGNHEVWFGNSQSGFATRVNCIGFATGNIYRLGISTFGHINVTASIGFGLRAAHFSSTLSTYPGGADVIFTRHGAGIVALNNTTSTPAELRIANTTESNASPTNYEWITTEWVSNVAKITTEAGGTGTVRGIQIQDSSSKTLGFFGATPVSQQNTTGTTTGFSGGFGTSVNDDSTFTGNVGSTAYTVGDIVRALKNLGLMAS